MKPALTAAVLVAVLAPSIAWADVPWSWAIAAGVMQWWVVVLALFVEWPFVRAITRRSWARSVLPTIVMNAISTVLGAAALLGPLTATIEVLYALGRIGGVVSFLGVGLLYLIAVVMSTSIEALVSSYVFGWSYSRRGTVLLCLANGLTVIGMFVGQLEPSPGPASLDDQQRIERTYVDEIQWMRDFLRQWPDRPSASAISSRYGSHALAPGARPRRRSGTASVDTSVLVAAFASPASGDTASETAGFAPPESVDTEAVEMAGFARDARRRPRPGTTMPTAFR